MIVHVDDAEVHVFAIRVAAAGGFVRPLKPVRTDHVRHAGQPRRQQSICLAACFLVGHLGVKADQVAVAAAIVQGVKRVLADDQRLLGLIAQSSERGSQSALASET